MSEYTFIGTCVKNPFKEIEILVEVTERARKVSREAFLKHCGNGINQEVKNPVLSHRVFRV